MKEETRKRLAKLILEELSDKIKVHEGLGHKLEAFSDLPVEKVADAILKQFEYLLTSDLRELIMHLIEQEVSTRQSVDSFPSREEESTQESTMIAAGQDVASTTEQTEEAEYQEERSSESIMEHFADKEPFPIEPLEIELKPEDWFYLLGFSYAPDSAGKGIPSVQIQFQGIDQGSNIFLMDYGDVRFYMSKLNMEEYTRTKLGEPTLTQKQMTRYKYEHEYILNSLCTQEAIVALPCWTIMKGHENISRLVEDRYLELLHSLIDLQDAIEWDVDALVFDDHLSRLPSITESPKGRPMQRETRRSADKGIGLKLVEKVIFREKNIAQEVHSQLLLQSSLAKIDYIVRLDSAFTEDWKSILFARYTLGKGKRKTFCQTVAKIQEEYKEFELMLRVSSPSVRFSLVSS